MAFSAFGTLGGGRSKPARPGGLGLRPPPQRRLPLEPNTLYLELFFLGQGVPGSYHWSLFLSSPEGGGSGYKYHIRQLGQGWIADHGPVGNAANSAYLVVAIALTRVNPAITSALDQLIRAEDNALNSIAGVTCRIWVLRVFNRMRSVNRFFNNGNNAQLEAEAVLHGNAHLQGALQAQQPRPVVTSQFMM